jgi:hypothetical protein
MRWIEVSDEYDAIKFGTPGFVDRSSDEIMRSLAIAILQSGEVDTMRQARDWVDDANFYTEIAEDGTMWTYAEAADLTP